MTAFHLASAGCNGEDLFGAIACLLCLLKCEVDPITESEISAQALFGEEIDGQCGHE